MEKENGLQRHQLINAVKEETGSHPPGWLIDYLNREHRLPIVVPSPGRGTPTLYSPDALNVIKNYMLKHHYVSEEEGMTDAQD